MDKEGQVTIFVIIALVIVGSLILFFVFRPTAQLNVPAEQNPQLFIQKCIRDETLKAVDVMLPQGGFMEPQNYKLYENDRVEYICYNEGNYFSCVNQHPMYINELRTEIENYLKPKIEDCFSSLRSELIKRNAIVSMGNSGVQIDLVPGKIEIGVDKKVSIGLGSETTEVNRFEVVVASELYSMANVAIEIANSEAKYCSFEYVGYMILHPELSIDKFTMSDGTKIYSIENRNTGEKLKIAIRGCVAPPGI